MPKPRGSIKIVLTGGHAATTAGALIEEINFKKYGWKVYWMGSKYALEGRRVLTLEYEYLPKLGVEFLPITTGRLQRNFTFWTIPSLLKVPIGIIESFFQLIRVWPKAVLSFGGFSSFPVVFAAKTLGIPILIHEQTAAAGRANLLAARFADKIALARETSRKYFPKSKVVITGNPVGRQTFLISKKKGVGTHPTIFVTGGSRGSQKLNEIIGLSLPKMLRSYHIIHQTGELDLQKFVEIKGHLPVSLGAKYEVIGRINPQNIDEVFGRADLVISRAGANTVSDIIAAHRPAILIPLPISYLDEQTENARFAEDLGFARIIPQSQFTPEKLLSETEKMFSELPEILKKINGQESLDRAAATKLADLLVLYTKKA